MKLAALLALFLLPACLFGGQKKEPIYRMGDKVYFQANYFYSKTCSGVGTIEKFYVDGRDEMSYLVRPLKKEEAKGCPSYWIPERELRLTK